MTRFFVPINEATEIQIDFTRRASNGIESDPRIHTREPSVDEIRTATAHIQNALSLIPHTSALIGTETP